MSEKKDRTCFRERPFICLDLFCTFPEPTLATCVVHAYDVHVWFINWDYYCDRLLTLPMHTPRSVITHQMRALDSGELPANIQFSFTLTYFASFIYSSLQQFHVENEEVRFWRDFHFNLWAQRVELRKHHWKKSPAPFGHFRFFSTALRWSYSQAVQG